MPGKRQCEQPQSQGTKGTGSRPSTLSCWGRETDPRYASLTGGRLTDEGGLEKRLRATETLIANGDDLPIGQLVALLQGGGGGSGGHLILEVQGHIAQLLFDVAHDLTLSCRGRSNRKVSGQGLGRMLALSGPPSAGTESTHLWSRRNSHAR